MKKSIGFLLSILMILAVFSMPLSAAGQQESNPDAKEIVYWSMWNETEPQAMVLKDAIKELKRSSVVREALGEHVVEKFIEAKQKEWNDFRTSVTEWEVKKYL